MLVLPEALEKKWRGMDVYSILSSLEGKIYREKDGRKTFRFPFQGKHYYAKLHLGIGWKKLLGRIIRFRLPVIGAQNEWRAIQRIEVGGELYGDRLVLSIPAELPVRIREVEVRFPAMRVVVSVIPQAQAASR